MNKLCMVGFGSLGKQILSHLAATKAYHPILFFDDPSYIKKTPNSFPFDAYLDKRHADGKFCVALGYRHLGVKKNILQTLKDHKRKILSFVHPSCFVHTTAKIGVGCFLFPLCNLDLYAELEDGVLLHNSVVVSHESKIQDCCYLSPGVVVSGHANLGRGCFIGSGSVLANGITLGDQVRIGLATAVARDVPSGCSAIGNPMKILSKQLEI